MLDALYMTVITISTTGFREVQPLTQAGRMFTAFLILSSVGLIAYFGSQIAQVVVESQFLRSRKVSHDIKRLNGHYIVCGYGRVGRPICEELKEAGVPFLIIENQEKYIEPMTAKGYHFIIGDATIDETLHSAGIDRARGLVTALGTDVENVYATLSAKELNPEIFIVSRALADESEKKLLRAGADRIVKPYEIGGSRMAQLLLRPGVVDFMDVVSKKHHVDLKLEEIILEDGSSLIDKTVTDANIHKSLNVIVVAIFRKDETFLYNPDSSTKLEIDDRLIAIGLSEDLARLAQLGSKN